MKLKRFTGKNIRGYLNLNIDFRDGTTFLIGINGSGKTSVLELIKGLLTPSYKILEEIEFSNIELSLSNDGKEYNLSCSKNKEIITIVYEHADRLLSKSNFTRINKGDIDYDTDSLNEYCQRFLDLDTCKNISKLPTPLFIGINRLPEHDIFDYIRSRRLMQRLPYKYRTLNNATIDNSLRAIQEIIFDKYRRNAAEQNKHIEEFRKKVISEALSLITIKDYTIDNPQLLENELSKYEEKKEHFIQALLHAGIEDANIITDSFFNHQHENIGILNKEKEVSEERRTNAVIGWFVCKNQLDKIDKIIDYEIEYEDKLKKQNEPFERFIECANMFFKESGKEIVIFASGEIKVKTTYISENGMIKNHLDEVFSLSSGEKQIVSLVGSLIFSSSNVRPDVIVIDEPELSLHLTWQEIFVDAMMKAQPQFQFILATHSPTIISKIERREWCEDLSRPFINTSQQ